MVGELSAGGAEPRSIGNGGKVCTQCAPLHGADAHLPAQASRGTEVSLVHSTPQVCAQSAGQACAGRERVRALHSPRQACANA